MSGAESKGEKKRKWNVVYSDSSDDESVVEVCRVTNTLSGLDSKSYEVDGQCESEVEGEREFQIETKQGSSSRSSSRTTSVDDHFSFDTDEESSSSSELINLRKENKELKTEITQLKAEVRRLTLMLPESTGAILVKPVDTRSSPHVESSTKKSLPVKKVKMSSIVKKESVNITLPPYVKPPMTWACLLYMAIKNSPSDSVTTVTWKQFVIHYFPNLRQHGTNIGVGANNLGTEVKWLEKTQVPTVFGESGRLNMWTIKKEPGKDLIRKWSNDFVQSRLMSRDTFNRLLKGESKISFDADGNVAQPDNIPVHPGSDWNLVEVVEYIIKSRGNSLSHAEQVRLIQEKFPDLIFSSGASSSIHNITANRPWFMINKNRNEKAIW